MKEEWFVAYRNWIVDECKKRGWSFSYLEEKAGIRKGSINKWCSSRPDKYGLYREAPSRDTCDKVNAALGVRKSQVDENVLNECFLHFNNWDIYTITCNSTKRIYVGRSRAIERRLRSHLTALRSNRHTNRLMQSDFNKYSEESFSFDIVFRHVSKEREKELMNDLNTLNPINGYNYLDSVRGDHRKKEVKIKEMAERYQMDVNEL